MPKILTTLPDCAQTIVYTMIVAAIRGNSTVNALIPPAQWTTYLDDVSGTKRNVPNDNNGLPCVRIMPFSAGVTPEGQTIQNAPMGLAVTVTTAGHDVRDPMNLWYALLEPVFTGDGNRALTDSIRAAITAASQARGKNIGSLQTIRLAMPSIGPSTDSQAAKFMTAEGIVIVEMTVPR